MGFPRQEYWSGLPLLSTFKTLSGATWIPVGLSIYSSGPQGHPPLPSPLLSSPESRPACGWCLQISWLVEPPTACGVIAHADHHPTRPTPKHRGTLRRKVCERRGRCRGQGRGARKRHNQNQDLPGVPVVENPPANTGALVGSPTGQLRPPSAEEQLSP